MLKKGLVFIFILLCCISSPLLMAQDWAQLAYYEKENQKLRSEGYQSERVVFMGNSITIGWLEHYPQFFQNKSYVNRGIGGQTTPQMLIRFRQDVVDLEPAAVVILAGTNDIAGNTGPSTLDMIMDNIKSMVEIAVSNNIEVVLASVLPAYDYPWRPGLQPNKKIPELNKMIKAFAMAKKLVYLDYFTALENDRSGMQNEYAYDGVHPNKKGYEIMAPLTEAAIKKALKK